MKNKLVKISLLCFSLFIASCGGGGGGAEPGAGGGEPDVPAVDPSQTLQWNEGNWDEVTWQ